MIDERLEPGQNARLQAMPQEDVRVHLSVTGAAPLRLLGVLLDANGRAINPAPLLTWRTPNDNVQIKLNKSETISAMLHTAAIREPIQSIMFLVAPYGREFFQPGERIFTAIASDGGGAMAIESLAPEKEMQAVAMCEFYHHPEQGAKIRARSEWRHREITTLLERLGVPVELITAQMLYPILKQRHDDNARASLKDVLKNPEAPHAVPRMNPAFDETPTEPRAAAVPTDHAPEVLHLQDAGAQQRLAAANGKFGPVQFRFSWHQRLATRAAVKMDVGCFWELQDDQKGQINRSSHQIGSLAAPPHIALDKTLYQDGAFYEETLRIDGDQWVKIRRILFYASILEGASPWDALDTQIKLSMPGQPEITADLVTQEKSGPVVPLLLLENRSDQLRVSLPGGCYDSHVSLDSAFDFQLGWQNAHAQKPGAHFAAPRQVTWEPRPPRGILPYLSHMCFGTGAYRQAEELMRAALAAAAMVLIADGRVTTEDRKHAIDAMVRLPIGKYFSEFEVRNCFDRILHDLKINRKAAESMTLKILSAQRGRPDTDVIIYGMRQIAMLDGQVTIHEERMVERLTRYLQPSKAA